MDLPPPPPLYSHRHHRHLRYGNALHSPDFTAAPYGTHLPPPQLRPPYFLHPPPPSPTLPPSPHPVRYSAQRPFSPPFNFSPPHGPIIGRSDLYEFDPPPKPYFNGNDYLPPPPPPLSPPRMPPRENIPLRFIHDYPERTPIFKDEIVGRGSNNCIRDMPGRNLRSLEYHNSVRNIGDRGRYPDVFYQTREMCSRRDDDDRRWNDGISDWGQDLYIRRDYDGRRWDCETSERDYGERRWSSGIFDRGAGMHEARDHDGWNWNNDITDWGRAPGRERVYDERIRNSDIIDREQAMRSRRDYDDRAWNYGIIDRDRVFYSMGNDDESRSNYVGSEGAPLKLDDDLGLGRFSGRLERDVSKGEFIKSKKRRLQTQNASHRTQPGKVCSWHSRGYKCQHFSKKLSNRAVRDNEKKGSEQLETRTEDKGEKEQSLVDLDISFKSNALIGKAIMVPPCPAVESNCNSMDVNNGKESSMSGSSLGKSDGDMVKEDYLEVSEEFLDKVAVFGSRIMPACDTKGLNVNSVKKEDLEGKESLGLNTVGPGRGRIIQLRKMRNAGKQLLDENNLQMTNVGGGSDQAAFPRQNSDTTLSKENATSALMGTVSDTVLPSSLGHIISKKGVTDGDSCKSVVSNLKRKRGSLTSLSASSCTAENLETESSFHAESFVTNTDDAYGACRLNTNGFACHKADGGDDMVFNEHGSNVDKFVHDRPASLDAGKRAIESVSQCTRFFSDRVDDICEHSSKDRLVMLENDFVRRPSEVKVSIENHDMVGSAKTPESKIPELHEDKYYPERHESSLSLETDSLLRHKSGNVTMSGKSSVGANSKEISPAQLNTPQVGVDVVEDLRSLEGTAGVDSSNVSLGGSVSSNFLSAVHKGKAAQFHVPSVDAKREKPFSDRADQLHSFGSVEGSRETGSRAMACSSSLDCSSLTIGKRKAIVAQMGLSDSRTEVLIDTFVSIDREVARCIAKTLVPAVEVDVHDKKDYSKKDASSNTRPSEIEDSTPEVDFGSDGSSHGHRKKRKVASLRSKLSSLSDDDAVADGFASDCSMLGCKSTGGAEWRADQSEGKVGSENLNVTGSIETPADGSGLQVNDELAIVANNISSCADGNGFCASNSCNELLTSGLDKRSCMSSPEELPSYSGFRFSRNSEVSPCQSENETIYWREDTPDNRRPTPADPNAFSFGKSLEKAVSDNSPTNTESPETLPEGGAKVVEKLNVLHGKLISSKNRLTSTAPRVFPGCQPVNSGHSRMFNSTHVTKSRTWHRAGNSTGAVTEPKVKPAPLPQSHRTKTARTTQSSYIRKGNSLVRKDSPSSDSMPGFHVPSSSVYRLTPFTENFKNTQASNSKTGDTDPPTQLRAESVITYGTAEDLPLKHNCKSLNCTACNLGESQLVTNVPSNKCPSKPLDSLDEAVRSFAVSHCQTGSANNSDSQSTLEEENSRKKITYVKRRSNQLVASSSSDDISKVAVDESQAPPPSDGYFKSKKYQLVRASSEDHDKKGEANVNPRPLDSHAILPRTSSRRQSGFAKVYRSSKSSLVWKLHDAQSSEKRKKVVAPRKVWPQLFPWKKATHWRSFMHALGTKLNGSSFSTSSQKLLLSRKRGAIYKRSTHGYSLRISKVLSVGGASLKWSKSIERNSKKANEEATRAVAAAEKRKKEEYGTVPVASKSRNHVSRKSVLNVKLRPGERIFRIGSERYRMDPTRRTLHRITEGEKESSSVLHPEKNAKRSYVPRRLLIGNDEYVRIGNGNKLVRDPKKWTRVLASEKVRWSLRTARLRMARKRKYCQFFTRFGKCNKADGKCPYIHDPSKIVVCTKFLNGSCSNANCKLTHKVIPERMEDCSYFLKGSCSNENCPYRHVNVSPDSAVCESFLRGYCADGNECLKKHTYVCLAYEATGICPQASTCKLHHPKKKTEKKPTNDQKIVRGRYFDGGLVTDCSIATPERLSTKGSDDIVWHEGRFPDYISLEVSNDEMDHSPAHDNTQLDSQVVELDELIQPGIIMNRDNSIDSSPAWIC